MAGRLRRDAPLRLLAAREAEAQKLPFRWSSHRAFRLEDFELELAGNVTAPAASFCDDGSRKTPSRFSKSEEVISGEVLD